MNKDFDAGFTAGHTVRAAASQHGGEWPGSDGQRANPHTRFAAMARAELSLNLRSSYNIPFTDPMRVTTGIEPKSRYWYTRPQNSRIVCSCIPSDREYEELLQSTI